MPGGSASSEQSARRTTERSDHSAAVMAIQAEKRSGYSDRPSCRKDGPCRTRRLRHSLSSGHGTPVSNTCKDWIFAKFYRLTPSGKTGVKPSSDGEGGGRSYAALLAVCEPFAIFNESLRLSFLVEISIMNTVFIVNKKYQFLPSSQKNFSETPFIAFHRKEYHI